MPLMKHRHRILADNIPPTNLPSNHFKHAIILFSPLAANFPAQPKRIVRFP